MEEGKSRMSLVPFIYSSSSGFLKVYCDLFFKGHGRVGMGWFQRA